jgi:broad specificity phosphatase PhoE
MRLIFARHGESQANVEKIISNRDLPHALTEQGRAQAETLADRLAAGTVAAIYASPILRAQETAQILSERLGLPFHTSDDLREFDCGTAEGRGDAEAWQAHNGVVEAWDVRHEYDQRIPDGESFNDLRARFIPFVEQLCNEWGESDEDIVCISHGSMLSQMLPLVLSNIDRAFTQANGLGNCKRVVAEWREDDLICTIWNETELNLQSRR